MTRLAALAATLLGTLALAGDAHAKLRFERCGGIGFACAHLSVPLDRGGVVKGRVSLYVKQLAARRGPGRGATFLLAGGPGQSATAAFSAHGLGPLAPAFERNRLVVYDQRGTGRSGALRCPAAQRATGAGPEPAAACAARLGARRSFYTTRDSVEDIESLRRALGLARITLVGSSYGTKVALGYALAYPQRTERLVLDSVVEPNGPSALDLDSFGAVARVLTELCAPAASGTGTHRAAGAAGCSGFTRDPSADLGRLVAAMAAGPLRGHVVDARGRPRPARLTRTGLFGLLLAGDLDPTLRAAYPGAVRAAVAGDTWPLMRLARRAELAGSPPPARVLSAGLFLATTCEETAFPWPRGTPPDEAERRRLAAAAAALVPEAAFAPFDRATAVRGELISLCARWPAAPVAPALAPGPPPDVPVLVLAGGQDLRTPLESAQRVAALFPRAALVTLPLAGHSVLGSDLTGCARRALAAFFAGRAVTTACPGGRRLAAVTPPPPTALDQVPSAPGVPGRAGRAVAALTLTLTDVADSLALELVGGAVGGARGGGLRAGRYRAVRGGIALERVVFVPGVRVSGILRQGHGRRSRFRLGGPAAPHGALTLHRGRLRGRLGATRVDARFRAPGSALPARAAAAR